MWRKFLHPGRISLIIIFIRLKGRPSVDVIQEMTGMHNEVTSKAALLPLCATRLSAVGAPTIVSKEGALEAKSYTSLSLSSTQNAPRTQTYDPWRTPERFAFPFLFPSRPH